VRRLLLGCLVAALLAAAPAAAQSDAAWAKLVAAAKQEGRVTLYSASVGTPEHVTISKAFEAKTGIKVDVLEGRASEIRERLRTEKAAGRPTCDVMWNGTTSTSLEDADGMLEPIGWLPRLSAIKPEFAAKGSYIPLSMTPYGMLINTQMVKPEEAPKSWHDLLAPKWKGKILSDDVRALGGGAVFFMVTYDHFGREFHEKLATQQLMFSRSLQENQRRTARGEYPVYIPLTLPDSLRLKGLPVKAILPEEGSPYIFFALSVPKGAPHPNAARMLINYFLEEESRRVFVAGGRPTSVVGENSGIAPDARAIAETKLLGTTDGTRQEQMLKLATEIYK